MGKNFPHRKVRKIGAAVAVADLPPRPKHGKGRRLTFTERYLLLEAHKANPSWSYAELARTVGCSDETARLTCLAAGRTAADLMAAYAAPMLKRWLTASTVAASRGDHRPSKEWLLHAAVLDPLPDSNKPASAQVVIINAPLPGMPGAQPLELTVQPAEHLEQVEYHQTQVEHVEQKPAAVERPGQSTEHPAGQVTSELIRTP